ncbi:hypothetical protein GCM10022247_06100 [Allokutzneria multivorans]|uniref:4-hydroxybenzoate polyprenyltransferase n=1 Tax=Allokutzneria multivorans TaxID=1142134 RepID=A0ABP7QZS8_9PSEU
MEQLATVRLGRFVLRMFRPHIYATYAVLWVLALEGSAVLISGRDWVLDEGTAVRAVSVVLVLLFMRMVDEQKDLEYDRVHNPDRPLVSGAITATELRSAMAVIAVIVAVLNAFASTASVLLVLADLGYGLFLVVLERWSHRIRDGLIVNLFVTYPVQLLLSVYLYVSCGGPADWRAVPLLLIFACVFLHFEFARKTKWDNASGERMYSGVLGPVGSAVTALGLGLGAGVLALVVFRPWESTSVTAWLPYLPLVLPVLGAWRFLSGRPSWPLAPAMAFVLSSYVFLILQAL